MAKQYLDGNGVRYLWTKLKNLLSDTVPSKSEVAANTEARHTHNNKTVLDGISASNVVIWNNKVENYMVTVTQSESGATSVNWQGIETAFNANKRVFCILNGGLLIPLSAVNTGENAIFSTSITMGGMTILNAVTIDLSNGNTTVEQSILTIPTKTSDLTNDSGFITSADGGNAATVNGKKIVIASAAPTNADGNTVTFVV